MLETCISTKFLSAIHGYYNVKSDIYTALNFHFIFVVLELLSSPVVLLFTSRGTTSAEDLVITTQSAHHETSFKLDSTASPAKFDKYGYVPMSSVSDIFLCCLMYIVLFGY